MSDNQRNSARASSFEAAESADDTQSSTVGTTGSTRRSVMTRAGNAIDTMQDFFPMLVERVSQMTALVDETEPIPRALDEIYRRTAALYPEPVIQSAEVDVEMQPLTTEGEVSEDDRRKQAFEAAVALINYQDVVGWGSESDPERDAGFKQDAIDTLRHLEVGDEDREPQHQLSDLTAYLLKTLGDGSHAGSLEDLEYAAMSEVEVGRQERLVRPTSRAMITLAAVTSIGYVLRLITLASM